MGAGDFHLLDGSKKYLVCSSGEGGGSDVANMTETPRLVEKKKHKTSIFFSLEKILKSQNKCLQEMR